MEYKFSDIFSWESGKPVIQTNGSVPVYGSNGIIGFTDIPKYKDKIILGRVGAYCGSVEYCKTDFNATDNTLVTTCDTSKILYGYAYYLLKQYKLNEYSGGSAQPLITQGLLKHLKCNLPSLAFQEKIISILDKYEKIIDNNNKRIKALEQMAENLYKEWFVRFRFPGHENAEFENGVPKGWVYTIVEDLSDILQRGISPDYDDEGELTVISQKCIRQSIMDIKEARKQTKAFKPELNLCDGDTVICSTGTGTLGRVGQVYGTYPNTTFDSHVTLVRAKPTIGRHFLFWSIKSMQIWFMNMGIGSTNQQELYRNTIRKAKVLNPDYELMNKFDSVIEPIHQEIIKLMKCQDNLIKQRDLLLPRLMSGKLEVKM